MYIYVYMYVIFKRNNCKKRATKVPKRIQPSGFNLMHNISSLWFFWAISLGFDKSWFDGDDLPSHGTIHTKHKKNKKNHSFWKFPEKKNPTLPRGGTVNGWTIFCQDAIAAGGFSRCWDRKALESSQRKVTLKPSEFGIWSLKHFCWKKIEKNKTFQMNKSDSSLPSL